MDAFTKLSYKQHLLPLSPHPHCHNPYPRRPLFSSISFTTQSFRPSLSSSLSSQIRSSSAPLSPSQSLSNPRNPNSLFSLLKTPLCVALTAVTLFFTGIGHRPLLAIAATPVVESAAEEEEREKLLEDQAASDPAGVQALRSLMEAKIKNKKLPEAIEVINRLIELEPEEIEWPLLRSHLYSYMGESELAKAGFEEILAKDPLRVEAFHGLVMAVSQGGDQTSDKEMEQVMQRIEGAMERCRREKGKDEVRDFKLLIAQIRVIEGNYKEALKVYQDLVKEEPRDFRPYLCQGIIYTLLRKQDEAEKQFDKYKRLVPKCHPYAQYFDDNMLATKVFSQMAENERVNLGSKGG